MKPKTFEGLFRGKYLFTDCTTFDQLIARCLEQAEEFKRAKEGGIVLDVNNCNCEDDYFFYTTHDAKQAEEFGMALREEEDDSDSEDDGVKS